jgi:hypothetical protein
MSFNREDYQRYVDLYESKLCTDVLIATNDKIPDIQRIESKENAKRLARQSGKSVTSDTLEGRIMQDDWGMAKKLAISRMEDMFKRNEIKK